MFPSDAVKTCVLFSQLYKSILKLVYGWKINLKMFGSTSKDTPNVESSVPLQYIPRKKIARSNRMKVNCFSSFPEQPPEGIL